MTLSISAVQEAFEQARIDFEVELELSRVCCCMYRRRPLPKAYHGLLMGELGGLGKSTPR